MRLPWVHNADESYSKTTREALFAVNNPIEAIAIGIVDPLSENISTGSSNFAINSRVDETAGMMHQGTQRNALRHVTWQATISSEFGSDVAKETEDAHEKNPNALKNHKSKNNYEIDKADEVADLLNNKIGRQIGTQKANSSRQVIRTKALETFRKDGLYVAVSQGNGNYKVEKQKISETQYQNALKTYKGLNNNGITPAGERNRQGQLSRMYNIRGAF